jgi:para-nitrobenzyl esterase
MPDQAEGVELMLKPGAVCRALSSFVVVAAIAALAAGPAGATTSAHRRRTAAPLSASQRATRVRTADGLLQGAVIGGGRQWLGVPYAVPPVGKLLWSPPTPAAHWRGVRTATRFGSPCLQAATDYDNARGSENCLYLNVYAPQPRRGHTPLAVMVWLHGGGFVNGSGNDFNGRLLAHTANAIVVTINYRLGPFGWLALKSLEQNGSSGDYGLMDQVAALKWVKRNIAGFGGNPGDVMLFGQSAGGESVLAQTASPLAAGLFERADAESAPTALTLPTMAAAEKRNESFAAAVGCTDEATQAACLRATPPSKLLAAANETFNLIQALGLYWTPVAGTPSLPDQWINIFKTGRFNKVPIMIGNARNEGRLFAAIYENDNGHPMTEAEVINRGIGFFGPAAPAVLAEYSAVEYPDPFNQTADVITDSAFACSNDQNRDALVNAGAPAVYSWEFTDPNAFNGEVVGNFHAVQDAHDSNMPFLFQWNPGRVDPGPPPFTPADRAIAIQMGEYWGNFARTGNPNGPGMPTWSQWVPGTSTPTQELTPGSAVAMASGAYYTEHKCGFWQPLLTAQAAL